jgi:hypothetical protein
MSRGLIAYLVGILFTFGLLAPSPAWELLSNDQRVLLVLVWPVTLGNIVYTQFLAEKE